MISKFYELAKFKNKINYYLFYGENDGQKLDTIESNFKNFTKENTYKYSEKDILADTRIFLENLYSKSFFEKEKLIIISDVTDKILGLIQENLEIYPRSSLSPFFRIAEMSRSNWGLSEGTYLLTYLLTEIPREI